MESAVVEATDVGDKITEEELKDATEESPSEAPAVLESTGKQRTHCRDKCFGTENKAVLNCMYDRLP